MRVCISNVEEGNIYFCLKDDSGSSIFLAY